MLVDSHCHLDKLSLEKYDGSLSAAINAAIDCDVKQLLCVSVSLGNWQYVVEIVEQYPEVVGSLGVHPLNVEEGIASEEALLRSAKHRKIVALGETGLDYHYSRDSSSLQQDSFAMHLVAAKQAGLPVIVHTRSAREDTLSLIRQYGCERHAGVLHCFTEDMTMATKAMDMNYMISISGIVTFNNAIELREVVKHIPLDRLLVETDSPYLAPVPYRGKPNEPQYVRQVAEFIADLRGISLEELSSTTTANFFRQFPKARQSCN